MELSAQASPDSSQSLTTTLLPASWYLCADIYRQEQEKLFHRSWIHVGHASRLPDPGDYLTYDIGGQSIIVMRGSGGDIGAFYNVCRHRASQLLAGDGSVPRIYCPYHGWTYDVDGNLAVARHTENVAGFDRSCWGLTQVRLERIAGFLFVCLDHETPSLDETYPGLAEMIYNCEPEVERLVHTHRMTYDLACNWKIAVENYTEGYHVRTVHPALFHGFDMDGARWDVHERYFLMYITDDTPGQSLSKILGDGDSDDGQTYDWSDAERTDLPNIWMWPMVMFERMPGRAGLFTYNHVPMGSERTLQVVDFYFTDNQLNEGDRQQIDYVDLVRREDVVSIESVQRGIRSKGWGNGPLLMGPNVSPGCTESNLLHFQKIVWQLMEEPS